jgi:hypothetical protein
MLIRHSISTVALSCIFMKGISGTETVAALKLLEINLWFSCLTGYKDTVIFVLTELEFMIIFHWR